MFKPSSVIKVPTTLDNFFENWLIFLRPFHGLTDRQIRLAAAFLKERYELSKVISDENILDETLFSPTTRERILSAVGFEPAHYRVLLGDLRKRRFFIDKRINKKYIPNLSSDNPKSFSLMVMFDLNNDSTGKEI